MKASGKVQAQDLLVVFNTANKTQHLDVITQQMAGKKADAKLVYGSASTVKADEIAPLSFAIYRLK